MLRFQDIWSFQAPATYTDLTDNTLTNTDFNFISGATDVFYFGLDSRFTGIYCDLTTNGSYTGLSYEYYDGDAWRKLALIDNYSFNISKYVRWVMPSSWVKDTFIEDPASLLPSTDVVERYWVRIKCTAVATIAVINKIRAIPYVEYSSPSKVFQLLQFKKDFTYNSTPLENAVEDFIRRAEDRIDYLTYKSWKFNVRINELIGYNRYGIFPRRRDILKMYSVSLWNGNIFDQLVEGRNNDYFVDYERGMIYFTRMFLLPAAYGMVGRYFLFGMGEFAYAVQLDYAYGRDSETSPEFHIVENIATKMAAVDVLRHHDYSSMIVSGTDKVSLDSKIQLLEADIDRQITELQGIQVW